MSYQNLLEYGKNAVEDYNAIIEKQLLKAWEDAYKIASSQLSDFMARFGDIEEAKKYNRLEALKKSIAEEIKKITNKSISLATNSGENSFSSGFNSAYFGVEQAANISTNLGIINVDAVRDSVFSDISGADFTKRFGKLYTTTIDKVAEIITRGLAIGQGYAKTAAQLKDAFEGSYYNAIRVVRTESTRNFNNGNNLVYERLKENGIDGVKVWIATFDGRTRPDHAEMNGVEANEDGVFETPWGQSIGPGDGPANEVINCRCSTYYKLKGFEKDYSPDWSYAQWKNKIEEWKQKTPKTI